MSREKLFCFQLRRLAEIKLRIAFLGYKEKRSLLYISKLVTENRFFFCMQFPNIHSLQLDNAEHYANI